MTCIAAKINLVSRKSLIGIARPYVALLFRHKCNSLIHTMPYLSLERLLEYFRTGHSVSFSHRPQDDKVSLFNKRFTPTWFQALPSYLDLPCSLYTMIKAYCYSHILKDDSDRSRCWTYMFSLFYRSRKVNSLLRNSLTLLGLALVASATIRVPLYRMKTARRTLEDAARWVLICPGFVAIKVKNLGRMLPPNLY